MRDNVNCLKCLLSLIKTVRKAIHNEILIVPKPKLMYSSSLGKDVWSSRSSNNNVQFYEVTGAHVALIAWNERGGA